MDNSETLATDPGSIKVTDISYRLRFQFVSFAYIVLSFFVFRSFGFVRVIVSFVSCIVRFVRQFNETNTRIEIRTNDTRNERMNDTRVKNKVNCALTIHKYN